MKIKNFMLAATLFAVAFTSCSEDTPGVAPEPQDKEQAGFYLEITEPITYAADPDNATTAELLFNTVDILIYDGNILDKFYTLDGQTDFSSAGANRYISNDTLSCISGDVEIYVGVNLPPNVRSAISSYPKSSLSEAVTVALADLTGVSGFAMFSAGNSNPAKTLLPKNQGVNTVSVAVERMVAKVSVENGLTYPDDYKVQGGTVVFNSLYWDVLNLNTKMYPYQQYASGVVTDPNYTQGYVSDFISHPNGGYRLVPDASNTLGKDMAVLYLTENTHAVPYENEVTFVTVRARFFPDEFVDGDGVKKGYGQTSIADFWTVTATNGRMNYFDVEAEADTYITKYGGAKAKYEDALCYYKMYINYTDANNQYGIIRNQYYRAKIARINGLGDPNPYPGPDPIPGTANVVMIIDILPWAVISEDHQLRPR